MASNFARACAAATVFFTSLMYVLALTPAIITLVDTRLVSKSFLVGLFRQVGYGAHVWRLAPPPGVFCSIAMKSHAAVGATTAVTTSLSSNEPVKSPKSATATDERHLGL